MTHRGYSINETVREQVYKIDRREVAAIKLEGNYFTDPYGHTPEVKDARLVNALLVALAQAEQADSLELADLPDTVTVCKKTGRSPIRIPMIYECGDGYAGPAWRNALTNVQKDYALQLRRRLQNWDKQQPIQIYYEGSTPGQRRIKPLAPVKTGLLPGSMPFTRYTERESPLLITSPNDIAQIINALTSRSSSLYAFQTANRLKLRIDGKTKEGTTAVVYVTLPMKRFSTWTNTRKQKERFIVDGEIFPEALRKLPEAMLNPRQK
ncbi:MAG: hypothetical protein EOO39_10745 [Cytophagaceae bacterium]|nr:MAG: hypothetical protein EOO39_10745 [Cytophagaceae bacterium]